VRPEGLGKLTEIVHFIGCRTRYLTVLSFATKHPVLRSVTVSEDVFASAINFEYRAKEEYAVKKAAFKVLFAACLMRPFPFFREAICSSETSLAIYRISQHYVTQHRVVLLTLRQCAVALLRCCLSFALNSLCW
jgi:hypothetical protein